MEVRKLTWKEVKNKEYLLESYQGQELSFSKITGKNNKDDFNYNKWKQQLMGTSGSFVANGMAGNVGSLLAQSKPVKHNFSTGTQPFVVSIKHRLLQ